tara:strand:- start:389 stop:889 length:501 start_codon:yes stop_codon:yes gene_type:complete
MTHAYVAAALADWPTARHVMTVLRGHGVVITHDWTVSAESWHFGDEQFRAGARLPDPNAQLAQSILRAVYRSDVVIFIGPGRRGAHVELGAALASPCRVILVPGNSPEEYPCPFHYHPAVRRVETIEHAIRAVLGVTVEPPEDTSDSPCVTGGQNTDTQSGCRRTV